MDTADVIAAVQEARRTGAKLTPRALVSENGALQVQPENLTASVPAGYSLGRLQADLAVHGLFYPPALHLPSPGSMGEHLATGSCGPWRLGRGTARDWVLGLEVVTGAGELIRTGSGVVKNVAGLDLTKLMIGSRGRLGVILRAFVRLAPLPEQTALVAARFPSPVQALTALPGLLASPLAPSAVELDGPLLIVGLEGTRGDLPRRTGMATEALKAAGGTVVPDPGLPVPPLAATAERVLVRAGLPAAAAPAWVDRLPPGTPLQGHAGNGIYLASLAPDATRLTELADLARELGGYLTIERGAPGLPPSLLRRPAGVSEVEQRIRQAFDPDGVFDGGRATFGP